MGNPYLGEIRLAGFNYAPVAWHFCDGSLLAIADNGALFNLLGTTYGGDGVTTFAVPDLRGRVPLHLGNSFVMGQAAGQEQVTLVANQVGAHSHSFFGSTDAANQTNPTGRVPGQALSVSAFQSAAPSAAMNPSAIGNAGSSVPHNNMQPSLAINYIISLTGIFPPTN